MNTKPLVHEATIFGPLNFSWSIFYLKLPAFKRMDHGSAPSTVIAWCCRRSKCKGKSSAKNGPRNMYDGTAVRVGAKCSVDRRREKQEKEKMAGTHKAKTRTLVFRSILRPLKYTKTHYRNVSMEASEPAKGGMISRKMKNDVRPVGPGTWLYGLPISGLGHNFFMGSSPWRWSDRDWKHHYYGVRRYWIST